MTSKTATVADRLVDAMLDADWDGICQTYAADVLIDMNLPTWRFQLQGRETATNYFHEQTSALTNLRLVDHQVHRTDDVVIIEEEMRFDGADGEYLWRAVDIFHMDRGVVTKHVQYCTGCWPPTQIARQAQEAPMVRW